ncbi:diguanylate cyclase [Micromonospora cathayae]|uniref:Diguanylate cyclase n=1 Tax=Micromonospora cathayae TaxID=3028804 RepID=A0ABY7ZV49_9ACTN|nr:diguanylate cyclase [Micromonospora sp. HUAS 3]WDZ86686.1 diguanylate cyclase [Micromonospora sp. HUAS 3]
MTLRGRLTAAFLAVVLGPVLLGAFFVGTTLATVDHRRSTERLGLAVGAVRTSVDALCQQLRAAADAVALNGVDPVEREGAATQAVSRGLAAAVLVTDVTGRTAYATPDAPDRPWLDCAGTGPTDGPVRALTAEVELRDAAGAALGRVAAAQRVDPDFVARLAAVTGVGVTLLAGTAGIAQTTEVTGVRDEVLAAAAPAGDDRVTGTGGGRYVRRAGPVPGQPLPLLLSVPSQQPPGLYAALMAAVLFAGLLAVLSAWRLARVTTRPLAELALAVERVAQGDLTARVPVRARDEIGRLAGTFNRMTRETQSYVAALTSSRDQLRGHLAVLGDTLASTHDLDRILRVILHSAIAATGARAGAVLLVEEPGILVGQCVAGLEERWPTGTVPAAGPMLPEALRVPVGTGIVGTVAATGEPRRGRIEPGEEPAGEPRGRTYVAVPFAAPGALADHYPARPGDPAGRTGGWGDHPARPGGPGDPAGRSANSTEPAGRTVPAGDATPPGTLGVLVLYDRLGADEFDDDDLVTLRTFAGHAAVAVENVRVHQEAQRLSLTDPLTGLWNYRYLRESIRREVERASRFGRMLSVLALDLDRFKAVNDTYGHTVGDAVLVEFAHRVRGEIREVDLAFRQGGEEFVLLLPETDARGAAIVAERLGAAVRDRPFVTEPHSGPPGAGPLRIPVTVSVGIAVYPDHAGTGQQVLDAADDALYAAKGAGRDTYRLARVPVRPTSEEITVATAAVPPEDGLPRAGSRPAPPEHTPNGAANGAGGGVRHAAGGGASSGPHPPRQTRGR